MSKRLSILLILSLCSGLLNSKDGGSIDSFRTGYNSANLDDSVDLYLRLASELVKSNPSKAFSYAAAAEHICIQLKSTAKSALACKYMGNAKIQLEEYYEAKKYLLDAFQYYSVSGTEVEKAGINYSLGITGYYLGEYQDAILNYRAALQIYNKLGMKQEAANTLQNVGLVHHELDDINKAALYYKEALDINRELKNDTNIAGLYQDLGIIYYRNNQFDEAINYYEKSISIFESLKDTEGIATTFSNIGLIHLEQKDFESAFNSFNQSKRYFESAGHKIGTMWATHNMGIAKFQQKDFVISSKYFNRSLESAKEMKSAEGIMSNYKALSDLYTATADYKKALELYTSYTELRDSTHSAASKDKIAELETLYNLETHEKKLAESVAELKHVKAQKFGILVLLCILLVAAVVIYFAYRQKKAAEKKLASHKSDLENIIIEKTLELDNQITERKIAEESDKLKSAFLANMSHELRTPMNAIIAFSHFLHEPELPLCKRDEYLEHITTAGETLLRLIDDIIDIAKLETNQIKISISPANISRLLREIYRVFYELKLKNNYPIDFHVSMDREYDYIINTDVLRLRQILNNLLGNAFKYTPKGEIEFGFKNAGQYLEFFVRDTGIGIAKEKHSKIFERFSQIENNLERKFGGTGLGLAISKNLVELLGGEIRVESTPGKGSTFFATIPALELREVPVVKEFSNLIPKLKTFDYNWKDKTILIAEDEELNYKVLDSCLSKTNARILRAADGKKAVEICRKEKVDIVLMDIQMPVMDGYTATLEIKKIFKDIPVIAQTSFAMANEKDKCIDAGCDDYITKPLDLETLLSKISRLMQ
jgi:signal transduction histidine kinase/tetratricopeptide (TPR) repeat protein